MQVKHAAFVVACLMLAACGGNDEVVVFVDHSSKAEYGVEMETVVFPKTLQRNRTETIIGMETRVLGITPEMNDRIVADLVQATMAFDCGKRTVRIVSQKAWKNGALLVKSSGIPTGDVETETAMEAIFDFACAS